MNTVKTRLGRLEKARGQAGEGGFFVCLVGADGAMTDAGGKPLDEAEYQKRSREATVTYKITRRNPQAEAAK